AELVLHVLDVSQPLTETDEKDFAESHARKRILVLNKIDLPGARGLSGPNELSTRASGGMNGVASVQVSCKTGQGIETLKEAIKSMVWAGEIRAEMLQVMINARHQEALNRARDATLRTITALQRGETLELAA